MTARSEKYSCSGTGRLIWGTVATFAAESGSGFSGLFLQTSGAERIRTLKERGGRIPVTILGMEKGRELCRTHWIDQSTDDLFDLAAWKEFVARMSSPDVRFFLSNKGENGYAVSGDESFEDFPSRSYPAQVTQMLFSRFRESAAPLTIYPLELIPNNAQKLQSTVLSLTKKWALERRFVEYLHESIRWRDTNIDRICPQDIRREAVRLPAEVLEHPLSCWAEPFACLVLERRENDPQFIEHPQIRYVTDTAPWETRKVRLLNGAHSALVIRWAGAPERRHSMSTVREAMNDPALVDMLQGLGEEIISVLGGRVQGPTEFFAAVLDRFRNPFFNHALEGIAWNHMSKVPIRLGATAEEARMAGKTVPILESLLQQHGENARTGRYEGLRING